MMYYTIMQVNVDGACYVGRHPTLIEATARARQLQRACLNRGNTLSTIHRVAMESDRHPYRHVLATIGPDTDDVIPPNKGA